MAVHTTTFAVLCDSQNGRQNINLQIGYPECEHHPLHFQADFLGKSKGCSIPSNIMDSMNKIYKLSIENNVDFVELAEYAIKSGANDNSIANKKASVENNNEDIKSKDA